MIRKTCLLLLCLGLLSACERASEPAPPVTSVASVAAAAAEVADAAAAATVEPVESAVQAKPEEKSAAPVESRARPAASDARAEAKREPRASLDLDLPRELLEQWSSDEPAAELEPLLPPLFGEKPETVSPFQISGRLINNSRVDDYWDSVEGAELQFEFRQ